MTGEQPVLKIFMEVFVLLEIATVYVRSLIGILAASAVTALMIVKSGGGVDAEMFAAYLGAVVAMVLLGEKAKSGGR